MASCKECIHFDVCIDYTILKYSKFAQEFNETDILCDSFKPTADVAEVWHGEWIKSKWGYPDRTLTCSLCGFEYDSADYKTQKFEQKVLPYCPNCGARMDGMSVANG